VRRVLIVEDQADTRAWMQNIVARAFPQAQIEIAWDLRSSRERLIAPSLELVLLDLGLPDGSGLDLIPHARALVPPPKVVITTVFDDPAYLFPALKLGAEGYLLKDERADDLVRSLCAINDGVPPLSPSIARAVIAHFSAPAAAAPAPVESLTEREREVIALVAEGLTVRMAAERLGISHNTVATHIKRAYAKLDVGSRAQASLAAARLGLVQR
jgi:DNA-binding NarL/FixJ family response regulator